MFFHQVLGYLATSRPYKGYKGHVQTMSRTFLTQILCPITEARKDTNISASVCMTKCLISTRIIWSFLVVVQVVGCQLESVLCAGEGAKMIFLSSLWCDNNPTVPSIRSIRIHEHVVDRLKVKQHDSLHVVMMVLFIIFFEF